MDEQKTNWTLWIVVGAIAVLLLSCAMGALAGGVAGYLTGRSAAQQRQPSPIPFEWPREIAPQPLVPEPRLPDAPQIPDIPMMRGAGALVVEVVENSPAERAGIEVGAIILAVDGRVLDGDYTLAEAIARHDPGDVVELTLSRYGRTETVQVTLERHPERGGETAWLGVGYRNLGEMPMRQQTPRRNELPG